MRHTNRDYSALWPRRLRSIQTDAEQVIWAIVRGKNLGVAFRRQHPIGRTILDFYSTEAMLCIELDGEPHFTEAGRLKDQKRDAWLHSLGIEVLRIENRDAVSSPDLTAKLIQDVLERRLKLARATKADG